LNIIQGKPLEKIKMRRLDVESQAQHARMTP
jgi:hypothetical protein